MLKENRRTLIITSIVTILPILIGVIFWNRLPDVMATHFGIGGKADGFSSKAFAVFGIPLFCLALLWVGAWITARDPRRRHITPKVFSLVLWALSAVSLFSAGMLYPYNLGYETDIRFITQLMLGVLFVVIGNYLPKTKRNYTVGIRVPWTLDNDENWNRTHRLGGFVWVAGGIILIALTLIGWKGAGGTIGVVLAITLIPCVYSYRLHVKEGL